MPIYLVQTLYNTLQPVYIWQSLFIKLQIVLKWGKMTQKGPRKGQNHNIGTILTNLLISSIKISLVPFKIKEKICVKKCL